MQSVVANTKNELHRTQSTQPRRAQHSGVTMKRIESTSKPNKRLDMNALIILLTDEPIGCV